MTRTFAAGALLLLVGCGGAKERTEPPPLGGVGTIVFSVSSGLPAFQNTHCEGLWAIDPDGSNLTRIAARASIDSARPVAPLFSPTGKQLAFERAEGSGEEESYDLETTVSILDTTSGRVRPLTKFTSSLYMNPRVVWLPDAAAVLVLRKRATGTELARLELPSGEEEALARRDPSFAASIAVAPDGSRIAFWAFGAKTDSIWLLDSNGKRRHELDEGAEPAWSPDSSRLAFLRPSDPSGTGHSRLFLVDSDGSSEKMLAKDVQQHGFRSVLWSPGGDRLMFLRKTQGSAGSYGESDVYLLELDGHRETLRMRHAIPLAWSRDGRRVLFGRPLYPGGGDPVIGLYMGSPKGHDERLLAVTDESDFSVGSYPTWQPTETAIVPAQGSLAPKGQDDSCARKLRRLRERLSAGS